MAAVRRVVKDHQPYEYSQIDFEKEAHLALAFHILAKRSFSSVNNTQTILSRFAIFASMRLGTIHPKLTCQTLSHRSSRSHVHWNPIKLQDAIEQGLIVPKRAKVRNSRFGPSPTFGDHCAFLHDCQRQTLAHGEAEARILATSVLGPGAHHWVRQICIHRIRVELRNVSVH